MSLPPGFLDELRTRVSLAQVVGRKVTWDVRKTNAGKGDHWAPCPFHQEKSASFHVDDRKGFYYCFGCHAKGDAISFVKDTENVSFIEAVEILAREAGMAMPERDPRAQDRADSRMKLVEVMEQAVQFYRLQLRTARAQGARDYLARRGLQEAAQARHELGFAPDDRTALTSALTGKGIAVDLLAEAGLVIVPEDGGRPFDRFRGRIMFPIRDVRGRAIAFGGRAMSAEARAKYLNSPETPLFDKGRSLFNHQRAREAAGKAGSLIVAEGYMDVIALSEAGFEHAVAPLGTAITPDQLALMWRMADEPIIALDGDTAGLRAAMRVIDIALPLVTAGKSLRFCVLPEGLDPDDLLRAQGAPAMQALLDGARPMVDLLWQRETEGKVFDSPERRAALDKTLRSALQRIADPSIRAHYEAELRDRRAVFFRRERPPRPEREPFAPGAFRREWKPGMGRPVRQPMPTAGAKSSLLARSDAGPEAEARVREAAILCVCLNHPGLAAEYDDPLDRTPFLNPDLAALRAALLAALSECLDKPEPRTHLLACVRTALGEDPMPRLMAIGQVRLNPHLGPGAEPQHARTALADTLAWQAATVGMGAELREALQALAGRGDTAAGEAADLTWRIGQAAEARNKAARGHSRAAESATVDEESLSAHLQSFIDDQIWVKKKR
ncbi:DNA primase [Paroceanicella profunda]|uniref:DNA primase n=1 Tax=Paroceanicella profunda TaxID=2579971 RepID=A0A5B8FZH2_9RHOB|nr:DNA primase [Paroceanicella profunda]QDL93064.1 DNA primase [Paroceanicella profunda]